MTEEQRKAWSDWLETRPERVKVIAERFDPTLLYSLKSEPTDLYKIKSFSETNDGVTLEMVRYHRETKTPLFVVFGIPPDDVVLPQ